MTIDQNEDRSNYVGGSDISCIMGMNRWKTPLQLWLEKTGEVTPKDLSKVEAVQLGTELEEFVAQKFSRETGKQVRVQNKMYQHPDYPYMVAHIDRLITGSDELLECKTCSAYKKEEWDNDCIPQEYILQVIWYLGLTGRKKGYIAVLIGGQSFKYKEIDFDRDLFEVMVEKAKEFWDLVKTNTPPQIMANDGEVIAEMFPKSSEEIFTEENEEMETAVSFRQELKNSISELNEQLKEVETKIKNNIKSNLGFQTQKYVVTWKETNSSKIDRALMLADGVLDKYVKQTSYRVLKVKNNPNYEVA